jgi:hypothetical protein
MQSDHPLNCFSTITKLKVKDKLERDFFQSTQYTLEAKERFIEELIAWLETMRKKLRS